MSSSKLNRRHYLMEESYLSLAIIRRSVEIKEWINFPIKELEGRRLK
jgi:hypothetical protein